MLLKEIGREAHGMGVSRVKTFTNTLPVGMSAHKVRDVSERPYKARGKNTDRSGYK
jgi:hypothetical protein